MVSTIMMIACAFAAGIVCRAGQEAPTYRERTFDRFVALFFLIGAVYFGWWV